MIKSYLCRVVLKNLKMTRKTIALMVLNVAAAMAIGLCAGIFYKYSLKNDDASGNDVMRKDLILCRIAAIADSVDAKIGVAAIFSTGDTLLYDNAAATMFSSRIAGDIAYPLLSVVKFHQALAVCDWLGRNDIPLDSEVQVTPDMLQENTWSPLRDSCPQGGSFSYRELLEYTLESSDNNACDILFSLTGGPEETDRYIRSQGISDFNIECTEAMMHEDISNCYRNWSTPLSAVLLLEDFYATLGADKYSEFVWQTMASCRTGQSRIPGRIRPEAAMIVHKTGTGDIGLDGRIMAVNDIGIIVLPDGTHISLAVFISDAACSLSECEKIIADMAAAVLHGVDGTSAIAEAD